MIELRTLGALDLRDEAGREMRRVLAQPKRLALLLYLALTRTTHRRDSVLALFWPDHDEERARLALRQSVHFLRTTLGPEVIASRSGEELALGNGVVRCDATEFQRALDGGRLADALDLYRGDPHERRWYRATGGIVGASSEAADTTDEQAQPGR